MNQWQFRPTNSGIELADASGRVYSLSARDALILLGYLRCDECRLQLVRINETSARVQAMAREVRSRRLVARVYLVPDSVGSAMNGDLQNVARDVSQGERSENGGEAHANH